jgi:aryl-alcohol dehydrogenase-like predicted oxidoreductase
LKLGLGTVQFGMDYGVSNDKGQTRLEEAVRVIGSAISNGIRVLDTAPLYGTSEELLGSILPHNHPFSVVTKTPKFNKPQITLLDAQELQSVFFRSLDRLRQDRVYGLLVHSVGDLFRPGGHHLIEAMHELKARGLVAKVGVSVYCPNHLDFVLHEFSVDLVQLPLNVFDQRMISQGYLSRLKEAGIEVHARSVFLQGLLLLRPDKLPAHFTRVRPHIENYQKHLRQHNLSPVRAAVGFVAGVKELDAIIVGVTNHQELQEVCTEMNSPFSPNGLKEFALEDASILDPSAWPT